MSVDTEQVVKSHEQQIADRIAALCKPPGSLGAFEAIAARLCAIQQTLEPLTKPRHVSIFAADHGVVTEGVSAWPSSVTQAVVGLMSTGRTASGVFARTLDCQYEVVDVGLMEPAAMCDGETRLVQAAKRRGTGNLLHEPAMLSHDFEHAWSVGTDRARNAIKFGNKLLIGGEMGIGNTTSASCLVSFFTSTDPLKVVGRGAGIDDAGLLRKQQVVCAAIERVRSLQLHSPIEVACQLGGLEIVALAGFYTEGARLGATIVVDGFIATAAALLAESVCPGTSRAMIAGHRSVEPGHAAALAALGLVPVLDLEMRLGEATGALAALPLIDLAAAMVCEMATLADLRLR